MAAVFGILRDKETEMSTKAFMAYCTALICATVIFSAYTVGEAIYYGYEECGEPEVPALLAKR